MSEQIKKTVENIKEIFKSKNVPFQNIMMELDQLHRNVDNLNKDELNYALTEFKGFLKYLSPMGAALFSNTCGLLIENGADPMIAIYEMLNKLSELLTLATKFNEACYYAGVPNSNDPHSIIDEVKKKNPLEAEGYDALNLIYNSIIAMLSKSKQARKFVKTQTELINSILGLSRSSKGANWLSKMVAVLDDEEIFVFYPTLDLGYRIKISGISCNYQLHLLLAGALLGDENEGWIPGKRPDPRLVSYSRDVFYIGEEHTEGFFRLQNWRALKPDGTLIQLHETYNNVRSDYYFIWGGEPPLTILKFDGIRVILLSDPLSGKFTVQRSFNARREFPFMDAELLVLEKLPKLEVQEFLTRIKSKTGVSKENQFVSTERQQQDMRDMLRG